MASPLSLPRPLLPKSNFLGRQLTPITISRTISTVHLRPLAKFNLSELMGGRGLCNGEKGIQKELKREPEKPLEPPQPTSQKATRSAIQGIPENAFEKELLGLTGGFPGGEKGLEKFIEKNPLPPKKPKAEQRGILAADGSVIKKKPKAPDLPLLLPGMIALVKNPNSPYYMYCGIVQRITDGKAGVLFEGGNWDRLITFQLEELELREKGPPMVNPRSVILESMVEKES